MHKRTYHLLLIFLIAATACQKKNPVVIINTDMGEIKLELYSDAAPVTVANFLHYVDQNIFDKASFYRVVRHDNQNNATKIEVVQGGLELAMNVDSLPPIPHESTAQTGILHKDGVISMARYGPGTATSEFFICIGDQPSLDFAGKRNSDGYGFAAFGKVIDGMDVVRKIQTGETKGDFQLLVKPVRIKQIYRCK
ncbi:MAG: peptidylprolyl isomerase [Bacteroidales bacterium]|nr:peptidylprolyl isomerase [Bacteroidales bacterium]